jgi:energy-converting hydrogenase Eha subunit A
MNTLKKFLGIIWMILAVATAYFCIFVFGLPKLQSGKQEDLVFGIIILFILTPLIVLGLGIFGYYSALGEYDNKEQQN